MHLSTLILRSAVETTVANSLPFTDSQMAFDSFATFIPLSVDSDAKSAIITDFFDLLSAIAAHGKMRQVWRPQALPHGCLWAFEHKETGTGFEGGYKAWLR